MSELNTENVVISQQPKEIEEVRDVSISRRTVIKAIPTTFAAILAACQGVEVSERDESVPVVIDAEPIFKEGKPFVLEKKDIEDLKTVKAVAESLGEPELHPREFYGAEFVNPVWGLIDEGMNVSLFNPDLPPEPITFPFNLIHWDQYHWVGRTGIDMSNKDHLHLCDSTRDNPDLPGGTTFGFELILYLHNYSYPTKLFGDELYVMTLPSVEEVGEEKAARIRLYEREDKKGKLIELQVTKRYLTNASSEPVITRAFTMGKLNGNPNMIMLSCYPFVDTRPGSRMELPQEHEMNMRMVHYFKIVFRSRYILE